ncbi:PAS domain-containing sensor histidine kinase [Geomonas sp.]|uniref:PAS domain-containing sensor histidine kinase n=1 Tax=Geomonas sp. TaxID=2651584 RepID=UPI002B48602F|nr:ATP-binding protein [Geomonas sp.]HJV34659.1 ATP-binding protein [Geomonas sp.]
MAQQDTESSYRALFEASPQPMLVCQRETGRLLAANEAALQLYGYGRDELTSLTLSALHPEGAPQRGSGAELPLTMSQRRKDGTVFEAELRWRPLEFGGQGAWLILAWERRGGREARLEQEVAERAAQLQAAQRELETFCYSVSHDLRAPLRHIDGFSRAVLDDYGEKLDHQAQEYLTRISQAAGKMSGLLDAMGLLARVARTELELQSVNLSVMAQIISLELKHKEPERKVEFRIAEGLTVQADARLTRQLMDILIGNAWKFSSKVAEAVIEIGSEETGGETVYYVKDNGAGFDMEYAEKLFSIFHRLHRADEFEGSGVGLAIAQRIIARQGGRIWAESAPAQGATFRFTLHPKS